MKEKLNEAIVNIRLIRSHLWGNGYKPRPLTEKQIKIYKKLYRAGIILESIGVK